MLTSPIDEDDPHYYEKETARLMQVQMDCADNLAKAFLTAFLAMLEKIHQEAERRVYMALLGKETAEQVLREREEGMTRQTSTTQNLSLRERIQQRLTAYQKDQAQAQVYADEATDAREQQVYLRVVSHIYQPLIDELTAILADESECLPTSS